MQAKVMGKIFSALRHIHKIHKQVIIEPSSYLFWVGRRLLSFFLRHKCMVQAWWPGVWVGLKFLYVWGWCCCFLFKYLFPRNIIADSSPAGLRRKRHIWTPNQSPVKKYILISTPEFRKSFFLKKCRGKTVQQLYRCVRAPFLNETP
jgi:hypothetical protein